MKTALQLGPMSDPMSSHLAFSVVLLLRTGPSGGCVCRTAPISTTVAVPNTSGAAGLSKAHAEVSGSQAEG